nr:methyl-accepting chemotaxis protein [Lachnospiraceae bacterium]
RINEIVQKLMEDASASVSDMKTLSENFEKQGEQLDATKLRMNNMNSDILNVTDSAEEISVRVENLQNARNVLDDIISDLSAISEENAASTQETNAAMQELNATFTYINEAAADLQKLSDSLDNTIGFFSV